MTQNERLYICNYIWHTLSPEELLAQLAEEGAELTHAALKLRRAQDGANPTPVCQSDAFEALLEEIADVALLVEILQLDQYEDDIRESMDFKLQRWEKRLKERKEAKK